MTVYDRFKRWKRRRGFGVHSPEAYRIVKRVIRPGKEVAYYGEEILTLSDYPRKTVRQARLLLRLIAYEKPAFVWTSPGLPSIFNEAIGHAGEAIRIFDGKAFPEKAVEADLVVIYQSKIEVKKLSAILSGDKPLIAFDIKPDFKERVINNMASGIIFEWPGGILAIPRSDSELYLYHI